MDEGAARDPARPIDADRPCRNCGDPTPGEYCPTCGQRKVDVRVSTRVLLLDVLEDQLLVDHRLPRTLGALLFRPGHLTAEFVEGRVARYVHPFRLYLVTSVIFFLLVSLASLRLVRGATMGGAEVTVDLTTARDDSAALARIDSALAVLDSEGPQTAPGVAGTGMRISRDAMHRERARIEARMEARDARSAAAARPDTATVPDPAAGAGGAAGPSPPATLAELFGWDETGLPEPASGIAAVDTVLAQRIARIAPMAPRDALEEFVGTFVGYIPTVMFLLLPVFALVLKLLYVRRRRFYAEHVVFLLHAHAFVFLLATFMLLLRGAAPAWLYLTLLLWIAVYIFLAMRRVYGQGPFRTALKYGLLGVAYMLILLLAVPFVMLAAALLF